MKRCNVSPYEGNEKYIFISYCHKDKDLVYPVIEHMAKDGYRIWYDEGINPGSDWPEVIAEHLDRCSICVSFLTENSVNSHNCRREINFALLKKKIFISVFLDKLTLSVGMEMQLSTTQSIFKYKYDKFDDFILKICSGENIDQCKGEPMLDIVISDEDTSEINNTYNLEDKTDEKKTIVNRLKLLRTNCNETIIIDKDNYKIGRKKELCNYTIEDNKTISRVHMILKIKENEFFVFDNNSLNGIKINGEKINTDTDIKINKDDEIRLGNEKFKVIIEETEI